MRPDPGTGLQAVALTLLSDLSPDIRTPFGQSTAQLAGAVSMILAQEFERLVDRLVVENEATAAILADACPLLPSGLADRVRLAVRDRAPKDLKVSTVQGINDSLRGLLIEAHEAVEVQDSEAARAINDRIWAELFESTLRRDVDLSFR